MEKKFLNRRLSLMEQEGVYFRANVNVGVDMTFDRMKAEYDAIVLAGGAGLPRDLSVPGRDLEGIHFAMEYLTLSNKRVEGDRIAAADFISAKGKNVVIVGGGDTGADCLGTVHRQAALSASVRAARGSRWDMRAADNPWPQWPNIFRVSTAHEEGAMVRIRVDAALQRRRGRTCQEAPWLEGRARMQGWPDVVRGCRAPSLNGRRPRAACDGISRP